MKGLSSGGAPLSLAGWGGRRSIERSRHDLGARLENALDEEYATAVSRGWRDVGNVAYGYRNLGAPRTLHATYSHRF